MAFKKVMTGGACQPDGMQGGLSQNAFTGMIDQFINANAMGIQMSEGYQNQISSQNMQFLEQQYANMMNQDFMQQEFERMRIQEQSAMPQQHNYFQHLQNRPNMMQEMNSIWDQSVNTTSAPMEMAKQDMMGAQPQMGMMFQQPWMNPMMSAPMYMNPMMQQRSQVNIAATQEETKSEAKEPLLIDEFPPQQEAESLLKNEIKETTGNMVRVLESSENPKHRNSKFLKFLKKLETGYYNIENDQLVKVPEKKQEYLDQEQQRLNQETMRQEEESKEQINTESKTDLFKKLWESNEEVSDEQFEDMMRQWESEGQEDQFNKLFMEEWGKQWQQEETTTPTVIPFEPNNKYSEQANALQFAKQLIEEGQNQEAIVCLQAEVTKNQDNAEAWRLMGQLYQENDQDDYAILAFKKAYEIDPYDLDSLLCLGISLTNELEQQEAVKHLHSYLKYHPEYSGLPDVQADNLDLYQVHQAFQRAFTQNPKDSNLCLAMGVLCFIMRKFDEAVEHFKTGIRENPTDHTLWNKYGAALANNMEVDRAISVYQVALDLRPNYVRTLANIGLAHRNKFRFEDSVPLFLNALVLNPRADQIWRYLRSSFLQMNRPDLVERANAKDANLFRDIYPLINPSQLPKPNLDKVYNNDIWNQ